MSSESKQNSKAVVGVGEGEGYLCVYVSGLRRDSRRSVDGGVWVDCSQLQPTQLVIVAMPTAFTLKFGMMRLRST